MAKSLKAATELYSFQKEGVSQIHAFQDRALLSDEMGLGKTIQAITAVVESKAFPVVVVCPAIAKQHWKREWKEHYNIPSTVLYGEAGMPLVGGKVYIINYDILEEWIPFLRRLRPKTIIGDEIHRICNISSKTYYYFRALVKDIPKLIAISGTPMTNRHWDLFSILNLIDPKTWDSSFAFGSTYCIADKSFGKWVFKGSKNGLELHKAMKKSCLIRRTFAEVWKQLPPLRKCVIPFEMEGVEEYLRAEADVVSWLAEKDTAAAKRAARSERFVRFSVLKQLAAWKKMSAVKEWVKNFLSESKGKLLLGTIHTRVSTFLFREFEPYSVMIRGENSDSERERAQEQFRKNPDIRILIGQIRACGTCINLPEATDVALAEFPFTPAAVEQFIKRAHRITSSIEKGVNVWFLYALNSIEEKLFEILTTKSKLANRALDGKGPRESDESIIDLLEKALAKKGRKNG